MIESPGFGIGTQPHPMTCCNCCRPAFSTWTSGTLTYGFAPSMSELDVERVADRVLQKLRSLFANSESPGK